MDKSIVTKHLAQRIRSMTLRTKLFKLLKTELSVLGYWRNKPRGDSAKGYEVQQSRLVQG